MTTVFTPMPLFNRPGPLRDLLEARSLSSLWLHGGREAKGKASPEERARLLLEQAPEIEYLLVGISALDRRFFEAAKKLKLVAMFGVGLDHIDLAAATEHGVLVTNVPGGNTRCVTELVFAMMLDLAHKVTEMHMSLVSGSWKPRMGSELSGKTLGIVGLGHIGRDVATLGKALGMRVIAANRTPRPEAAWELGIEQMGLDAVLSNADYITLHIPGGPDSWHLGASELARVKKGAFLINTARGDLVDLDALAEAIKGGRLAGAGLDVFPYEPMDHSHLVFSLPQVVVTPHAGALSREAMARVAASCLDEVVRVLEDKRSPNARNAQVYAMPGWIHFS